MSSMSRDVPATLSTAHRLSVALESRERVDIPSVLQVRAAGHGESDAHPSTDGRTQQGQSLLGQRKAVSADLFALNTNPGLRLRRQRSAVEQEPQPELTIRLCGTGVHADQTPGLIPPGIVQPDLYVGFRMSRPPCWSRMMAPADTGIRGRCQPSMASTPSAASISARAAAASSSGSRDERFTPHSMTENGPG